MFFRFQSLIFPVCKKVKLVIEPAFPVQADTASEYAIDVYPMAGLRRYGAKHPIDAETAAFFDGKQPMTVENGTLELETVLPQEDCYIVYLYVNGVQTDKLEIYALEEDLFRLNPYKGDNHMHTWMSDGKDTPMYMAASSCRRGYDYCVITDHKQYGPSLIARDFFAETGVDFMVIPGEEVHSPDNPVHIINLGGNASVNDWWRDCEPEYRAAVEVEMKKVDEAMGAKDRYAAAASQVIFDKIREVDGVAVLCHPHWMIETGYNETEDVTDYLFDHRRFDALELIAGGAYEDGTQLQLSYYHQKEVMPILGNSDAHGCFGDKLEPGNYTVVFAEAMTPEAIKAAIRAGRTIAGNENKLYGEYRFVKYGYFLQRQYFPQHKAMRDALGAKMLRYASARNGADSAEAKALIQPRPTEIFPNLRVKSE